MKSTPGGGLNSQKAKNKVVGVAAGSSLLHLSFRLLATDVNLPVLKHGPRSLTCPRVQHSRCWASESGKYFPTSGARMLGPEKWRTISAQAEVIGNFDGRSQRF